MHTLTRLAFKPSYGTQQLEQVFLLILFHLEGESHLTLIEMIYSLEPTQTLQHKSEFEPSITAVQSQQNGCLSFPFTPTTPHNHHFLLPYPPLMEEFTSLGAEYELHVQKWAQHCFYLAGFI